jgi:hypothetical protein
MLQPPYTQEKSLTGQEVFGPQTWSECGGENMQPCKEWNSIHLASIQGLWLKIIINCCKL